MDIYTWLAVKAWGHLFSGKRVFNYRWYQYIYGSRLKRGYIALVEKCWLFMSLYISGLNMYIWQAVICTCILLQYIRCAIPLPSYCYLSVAHMACYCNVRPVTKPLHMRYPYPFLYCLFKGKKWSCWSKLKSISGLCCGISFSSNHDMALY